MTRSLTIVMPTAELSPFSKSGGLGDVANALPRHLAELGHNVIVVTPFYSFIRQQDVKREPVGEVKLTVGAATYEIHFTVTHLTEDLPVYFVECDDLFNRQRQYGEPDDNLRFLVFNKAALVLVGLLNLKPHIIHCQDWHTGLIPNLMKTEFVRDPHFAQTATLFTIHNLPFQMQGDWWVVPEDMRDDGKGEIPTDPQLIRWVNFTRRAIRHADVINAVSIRYAEEILTPEFGQGMDKLLLKRKADVYGIINGIDYTVYNPKFDPFLWEHYDWNSLNKKRKNKAELQKLVKLERRPDIPVIGMVHRLTEQKGFDLIMEAMPWLLKMPLQLVVVGTGFKGYVDYFRKMAKKYPTKIGLFTPFTDQMASRVYAGSDMFLMPSRYEPCGISQLISMRYGSIPIVHETGGLMETITNFNPKRETGTGFTFSSYMKEDLLMAIVRALETYKYNKTWEHLVWRAMQTSFSWKLPAKKYLALYRRAMKKKTGVV
jgi:starch synthase